MKRARARTVGEETDNPQCILCYGDSNTFGQSDCGADRLAYADRWTTALQKILGQTFVVVPEGLNGRTTVLDDPWESSEFCGHGGEGMNGRRYLLPCLYSHRPLAVVVLALGCNDLKHRHNLEPTDIVSGVQNLVADIRKSTAGPNGHAPKIVLCSPPACKETATALGWGFRGCAAKSRATIKALKEAAEGERLPYIDLSEVAEVGADGIHFAASAAQPIATAVATAVRGVI